MVPFYGDFDTTETVYIPFNTFDSNDPSASVTATTLLASDVHVHKDGAVAQRTSTAGFTLSLNFDGVTGNHLLALDLSDNTDAGFWADGSQYQVRIEGATVDAGNINAFVGAFSIGRTLRPSVSGRTLNVAADGDIGGNVDGNVVGSVGSVTAAITLPSIPANWITAAGINASALDGKGDWNIGKTGYSISGTITTLDGLNNFNPATDTVGTVTTLTNLPAITAGWLTAAGIAANALDGKGDWLTTLGANAPANWINAAAIAASAMDGKGDWNIGKTGYSLTQVFPSNFADLSISLTTGLVDITQAAADKVWASVARSLTDKAGFSISGTITTLDGLNNFDPTTDAVATVTTLTNLPAITAGWLTAAGIAAGALNGKGDWNTVVPPTVAQLNARTLLAADYFDPATDTVVNVTTVATCTTNSDMRGTDNAALATVCTEARLAELDAGNLPADIAGLNNISSADVLTQVNAGLDTAISELGVGVPSATPSLRTGLMLLYMATRNQLDVPTSGTDVLEIHNDAGTIISKKALTDDGTDYSEAKMTSG